jgi:tRNA A37 threonylcarbamoyladenosine modification protein TsaB
MIVGVNACASSLSIAHFSPEASGGITVPANNNVEQLPQLLDDYLTQHHIQLTGLGTVLGPGSYTGTRLALTTLKMLGVVHNIPLFGASLFQVYMYSVTGILNELVILTSHSRKGMLNVQVMQSHDSSWAPVSSILQLSVAAFSTFLKKFNDPVAWHHIGDPLLEDMAESHAFPKPLNTACDVMAYLKVVYDSVSSGELPPKRLAPIYAAPAVVV